MDTSKAVTQEWCAIGKQFGCCVFYLVAGAISLGLSGCGDRAEDSRQQMHKFQLAGLEYAIDHAGEWPDRLDQLKDQLGGDAAFRKLMKNPVTGDDPGYEYVKPKRKLKDPEFDGQQVILYQLRGGSRDTTLKVGYADGSVRFLGSK